MEAVAVLGPTASGKSALALELAARADGEIISLDSALVYRGMDIGTAKPSPEERARIRHHLIDIRDPAQSYSAAEFRRDCVALVREIRARGRLPIICGGTMMYYSALVRGLSPVPRSSEASRARVADEARRLGWPALHRRLAELDPRSGARLSPNDRQRISRALEVYYDTGRPLSLYWERRGEACPFSLSELILLPENDDRAELRKIIRKRFLLMLEAGLVAEVSRLREREDLSADTPSMRSVGYRQVWEYLDGKCSYEEMIERAVTATARLAKHQMTWLRGALGASSPRRVRLTIGAQGNPAAALEALQAGEK